MVPLVRVYQATCRSVSVCNDPLNLGAEDVSLEIYPELREVLVQVNLVLSERDLVAHLMLPVILGLLLDGVIRQMNEAVVQLPRGNIILRRACPDVATTLLRELVGVVKVAFYLAVHCGEHAIAPDVEFPPLVQLRPLYVLLQDESPVMEVIHVSCEDILDLIQSRTYLDAISSVCVLTRLHNPNIMYSNLGFLALFGVSVYALLLIMADRGILQPIVMSDGWEFRYRGIFELT